MSKTFRELQRECTKRKKAGTLSKSTKCGGKGVNRKTLESIKSPSSKPSPKKASSKPPSKKVSHKKSSSKKPSPKKQTVRASTKISSSEKKTNLTVGELKKLISDLPNDMKVCIVRSAYDEYIAKVVKTGKVYTGFKIAGTAGGPNNEWYDAYEDAYEDQPTEDEPILIFELNEADLQ